MKNNFSKVPPHPGKQALIQSGPPPRKPAPRLMDSTGIPVPQEIAETWKKGERLDDLVMVAESIAGSVKYETENGNELFIVVDNKAVRSLVNQLKEELKLAIPHAVCPECNGLNPQDSCFCKGRGWLSEFHWKTCVTPETKRITGRK